MTDYNNPGLKNLGIKFGLKIVSKLMDDPDRAKTVVEVVGKAQQGRERIVEGAHRLRNAGQLPSREDMARLSRHVGALKRQARSIRDELKRRIPQSEISSSDDEA